MKYFDSQNKRLIMVESLATNDFWDKHWSSFDLKKQIENGGNNIFIKYTTKKYIFPQGKPKILEGGCGMGHIIYGLNKWGYDSFGIDYAKKTVEKVKSICPKLRISKQDVRRTDFKDNFFDGYWSLGVIEHFWNGYNPIIREARRIIKPGGYFFVTFPYLSPLRKMKAKFGFYKEFKEEIMPNNFYQFMLNDKKVISDLEQEGFRFVKRIPLDATKGIKDEVKLLKPLFQWLYDSKSFFSLGIKLLIRIFLSRIAGHSVLLVFRKK